MPPTATRLFVLYKLNAAFAARGGDRRRAGPNARFDVQVNQSLPFLNFTQRAVGDARGGEQPVQGRLGRDGSIYDELLVVRPPKRVLGGVTVRF